MQFKQKQNLFQVSDHQLDQLIKYGVLGGIDGRVRVQIQSMQRGCIRKRGLKTDWQHSVNLNSASQILSVAES